jgi:hypothetical protein
MSHESDSASRHRNMLKSLRVDIPHVGALLPAIGFVRQPQSETICIACSVSSPCACEGLPGVVPRDGDFCTRSGSWLKSARLSTICGWVFAQVHNQDTKTPLADGDSQLVVIIIRTSSARDAAPFDRRGEISHAQRAKRLTCWPSLPS